MSKARQAFIERMADFEPVVLAVPETYTPTDYLDESAEDVTASADAEMWSDEDTSSS